LTNLEISRSTCYILKKVKPFKNSQAQTTLKVDLIKPSIQKHKIKHNLKIKIKIKCNLQRFIKDYKPLPTLY